MAKKIIAIVSLVIVGILMITTIVLANITVNYSINCATPNEVYIFTSSSAWNSGSGGKTNKDEAKIIIDYINNASKQKCLTAIFNGSVNAKPEIVKENSLKTLPSISNNNEDKGYYVCFKYNNEQALMDGKNKFKDEKGNYYFYKQLFFCVKNVEGEAIFDVYVNPWFTANGEKNSTMNNYLYHYQLKADFTELYNYLQSNKW